MLQVKDTLRATVHLTFDGRVIKVYHGPNAKERFNREVEILQFLENRGCNFVQNSLRRSRINCGLRPPTVSSYYSWARGETQPKVLIIYDTMWGSTEKMAKAMLEGVQEEGVPVKLMNITSTGRTVIMKEVLDAKAILIGSPTLNNGMYPTVADFLCYMKGLKPQGKMGAVFGSYGWGGGATKAITEELQATGVELIEPPLQFPFLPGREELEQCKAMGKKIAARVKTVL